LGLYENAAVNVDHVPPGQERSYGQRIGRILNPELRGDGVYADLRINPHHALSEQLLWDAANMPENVGLSHDAEGNAVRRGDKDFVEEITRVRSVDLVSDPATTRGLFESVAGDGADSLLQGFIDRAMGVFNSDRPSGEIMKILRRLVKAYRSAQNAEAPAPAAQPAATPEGWRPPRNAAEFARRLVEEELPMATPDEGNASRSTQGATSPAGLVPQTKDERKKAEALRQAGLEEWEMDILELISDADLTPDEIARRIAKLLKEVKRTAKVRDEIFSKEEEPPPPDSSKFDIQMGKAESYQPPADAEAFAARLTGRADPVDTARFRERILTTRCSIPGKPLVETRASADWKPPRDAAEFAARLVQQ
jgi:hypothetical protein